MMIAISPDGTVPSTTAGSTPSISENAEFVPADIGEAVDNLRAEIASTRALVQQIRQKTISQP